MLSAPTSDSLVAARVLLLPGWLNSDPAHWQSRWEALRGFARVEQDDWLWPRRGDWMARLDEVVQDDAGPVVLVAHSLGCQLVAAWSAHSRHTARVIGAMLVAAPDTERADMPPNLFNWRPIVRQRLTFPSLVVTSSDDPYCAPARAAQMAVDWGSACVGIGARGHVNADSGLGDWPEGQALLRALLAGTNAGE
jgi:predicted alpha/beta hydrolase family esterase